MTESLRLLNSAFIDLLQNKAGYDEDLIFERARRNGTVLTPVPEEEKCSKIRRLWSQALARIGSYQVDLKIGFL